MWLTSQCDRRGTYIPGPTDTKSVGKGPFSVHKSVAQAVRPKLGQTEFIDLRMSSNHVETTPARTNGIQRRRIVEHFSVDHSSVDKNGTVATLPRAAQAMPGLHIFEEDTVAPPQDELFFVVFGHFFNRKQMRQILANSKRASGLGMGRWFHHRPLVSPSSDPKEVTKARAFRGEN